MIKWDYKIDRLETGWSDEDIAALQAHLMNRGQEGWNLVQLERVVAGFGGEAILIFKKPTDIPLNMAPAIQLRGSGQTGEDAPLKLVGKPLPASDEVVAGSSAFDEWRDPGMKSGVA